MTSSLNDNSGNLQNKIKIFFREIARTFNEHYIQPLEYGWYVLTLQCFNSSQCSKNEKNCVDMITRSHQNNIKKKFVAPQKTLLWDCRQIFPQKIWSQCLIQSIIVYKIAFFPQNLEHCYVPKHPTETPVCPALGGGTFIPSLSVIVKRVF